MIKLFKNNYNFSTVPQYAYFQLVINKISIIQIHMSIMNKSNIFNIKTYPDVTQKEKSVLLRKFGYRTKYNDELEKPASLLTRMFKTGPTGGTLLRKSNNYTCLV